MCAGLPVIATDRGCLRETVVEGVTGFIVPPNSPEAIAERLLYLIRSPEERHRIAKNARFRYEEEYTMPVFAARMADLFAQVIQSTYHRDPQAMNSRHQSIQR
jgi:glycosyltransferase involved in cell wall biosynthesis